jgi:hypothetical protein
MCYVVLNDWHECNPMSSQSRSLVLLLSFSHPDRSYLPLSEQHIIEFRIFFTHTPITLQLRSYPLDEQYWDTSRNICFWRCGMSPPNIVTWRHFILYTIWKAFTPSLHLLAWHNEVRIIDLHNKDDFCVKMFCTYLTNCCFSSLILHSSQPCVNSSLYIGLFPYERLTSSTCQTILHCPVVKRTHHHAHITHPALLPALHIPPPLERHAWHAVIPHHYLSQFYGPHIFHSAAMYSFNKLSICLVFFLSAVLSST